MLRTKWPDPVMHFLRADAPYQTCSSPLTFDAPALVHYREQF